MKFNLNCKVCGDPFESNSGHAKYCEKCKKEAYKLKYRKWHKEKKPKVKKDKEWGKKLVECIKNNKYPDAIVSDTSKIKSVFIGGLLKEDITEGIYKKCSFLLKHGVIKASLDGNFIDISKVGGME